MNRFCQKVAKRPYILLILLLLFCLYVFIIFVFVHIIASLIHLTYNSINDHVSSSSLRLRDRWFETYGRQCVVPLGKKIYPWYIVYKTFLCHTLTFAGS